MGAPILVVHQCIMIQVIFLLVFTLPGQCSVLCRPIVVVQADNRPKLDYLQLTRQINMQAAKLLNYDYLFINIPLNKYKHVHPATAKIYVLHEYIEGVQDGILIFLDADAWIQNPKHLNEIVIKLVGDGSKQGAFSRDPYDPVNTYINSGSFILKVNDYTKKMYQSLVENLQNDTSHHKKRFWDQYYISNFVHSNKESFMIFAPEVLNCPTGTVLRHFWWKNEQMQKELKGLQNITNFNFSTSYDNHT
jgi:hypothetical protein